MYSVKTLHSGLTFIQYFENIGDMLVAEWSKKRHVCRHRDRGHAVRHFLNFLKGSVLKCVLKEQIMNVWIRLNTLAIKHIYWPFV